MWTRHLWKETSEPAEPPRTGFPGRQMQVSGVLEGSCYLEGLPEHWKAGTRGLMHLREAGRKLMAAHSAAAGGARPHQWAWPSCSQSCFRWPCC